MNSTYKFLMFAILALIFVGVMGTGANDEPIYCYEAGNTCVLSTPSRVKTVGREFKRKMDIRYCLNVPFEITAPCNHSLRELTYAKRLLCQEPVCLCRKVNSKKKNAQYQVRKMATSLAANHVSCRHSSPPNPNHLPRVPINVCNDAIQNGNTNDGIWYRVAKSCKDLQN